MAALAVFPAELRAALTEADAAAAAAEHLAACSLLCAAGTAAAPPVGFAPVITPRATGPEPVRTPLSHPATRSQNPKPPAQAPPMNA